MSSTYFIALRYLRPRINLVTVITIISIGGIAIGTAALIIVLSVFNGFNDVVRDLLVGFDPHIRIRPVKGPLLNADSISNLVRQDPLVTWSAPYTSGRSAVIHSDGIRVIQIRGMRMSDAEQTTGLRQAIRSGSIPDDSSERHPFIILGSELSVALRVGVGDTVALLSQAGLEESFTMLAQPQIIRCIVRGVFQSQNKDYDAYWAFVSLETGRKLFDLPAGAMGLEIRLSDFDQSRDVAERLAGRLGPVYRIETWRDMHADLFAVMELERWAAFIILSLIIVVAVFNVLGSLTMSVIEKVRDIGILKAMGSTDQNVQRIYLTRGVLIGLIGTTIGLVIGLAICVLQMKYGFYRLQSGYFIIAALPVSIRGLDLVLIVSTAVLLSTAAALYPARRAASILPAEAIRWE